MSTKIQISIIFLVIFLLYSLKFSGFLFGIILLMGSLIIFRKNIKINRILVILIILFAPFHRILLEINSNMFLWKEIIILLLMFQTILMFIKNRKIVLFKNQVSYIILFFTFSLILIITNLYLYESSYIFFFGLYNYLFYFIFSILFFLNFNKEGLDFYRLILNVWFLTSLLTSCIAILQFNGFSFDLSLDENYLYKSDVLRVSAGFESQLSLGVFLSTTSILLFGLIFFGKFTLSKFLYLITFIINLIAIIFTFSRGSIVILLLGIFTIVLLSLIKRDANMMKVNKKVLIVFMSMATIVTGFIFSLYKNKIYYTENGTYNLKGVFFETLKNIFIWDNNQSNSQRLERWQESLIVIQENWFVGIGIGNTGSRNSATELITESQYLKVMVENGLIITFFYIVLLLYILKIALNRFFYSSNNNIAILNSTLFSFIVAIILDGLFLQILESSTIQLYFFLVVGLIFIRNKEGNDL